jgi:hypothetical protein
MRLPKSILTDDNTRFRGTWDFECDSKLCEIDGSKSKRVRELRVSIFEELKSILMKLNEKLSTISIKKIAREIRKLEDLYTPIEETHPYS